MVNKVIIMMHIVAYLAIIIVNVLSYAAYSNNGLRVFEITTMCYFAINSVCTVIFGVIVS